MNNVSEGRCPYCSNIFTVKTEIFDRAETPQPQNTKEQSDSSASPVQQLKSKIADYVCAELLISKHEDKYKKVLSAIECATSDL